MSDTLLVPTDFSANANDALNYAIGIAKKTGAGLVLIHAYHINYISNDVPMPFMAEEVEAQGKVSEAKLTTLCNDIRSKHKIDCDYINKMRTVNDLITDSVRWENPVLIVMGNKGTSGLKKIIFGSNTVRAIERAKCPVLAVPEKTRFTNLKRVVYATNYQANDIKSLKTLTKIAGAFNAKINVLHVCEDGLSHEVETEDMNRFEEKVKKEINYPKINFELIHGKYLEKSLDAYIKRESPDLLAMSAHKRTLYDKLFRSSDTKKMAYNTKIPLLAFHH